MAENSKLPKMRLLILTAAIATGFIQFGNMAHAKDAAVSEKDMLDQAVALYEKLNGGEVEVPNALLDSAEDSILAKAVVLGFANADELDAVASETALRKQDAMTVLYKTIIDFDDSFALSTEEVDEIMNKCYDNALIDEQNRVGYAFMLKHKIIESSSDTEPNKEITWDSCRILVDVLYDLFMQETSFDVNGITVSIGANIESVTSVLGEPDRIDRSDYSFDWYVYNSDYSGFMMIGVDSGRICAFMSNSNFSFNEIRSGDDYIKVYRYLDDDSYRFYEDKDGKLDAVIYNPHYKNIELSENPAEVRAVELVDLINANRAKNGLDAVVIDPELWLDTAEMAGQPKYIELARDTRREHTMDQAVHEAGYDIYSIYAKLLKTDNECLSDKIHAVGAATAVLDDYSVMASVTGKKAVKENALTTASEDIEALPTAEPVIEETEQPTAEPTAEPTETAPTETAEIGETPTGEAPVAAAVSSTIRSMGASSIALDSDSIPVAAPAETAAPQTEDASAAPQASEKATETPAPTAVPTPVPGSPRIVSPAAEEVVPAGKDVVIELEESAADEYFVQIYSIEDDDYVVNSYIKTTDTKLTFDAELFDAGKDYSVKISAIKSDATLQGEESVFQYGEAPEDSVRITAPVTEETTDNDFIDLVWESELYHDFIVDVYNEDGQLLLSQTVAGASNATIKNMDPGNYIIYVNAVRRGDHTVVKTHSSIQMTVELPEPIITEYLLKDGEKFYPVYEDPEMGIVYFYDEDLVDVEVPGNNGKTVTVQRKKITEKQVKATAKYRLLAAAQQKVEYFEGSSELQITKPSTVSSYFGYGMTFGSASGDAICAEAAKYLGVPYVWGGSTPDGFDCSGLVQYVFRSLGIEISRTTYTQVNEGIPVSKDELQPGDLIFFGSGLNVHHVGIYVGNGMMIHAPRTGTVVQYQSIDDPYYASEFSCARRFVN